MCFKTLKLNIFKMIPEKKRIAVFCSGGGSNFKALYAGINSKQLPAEIVMCLSNRSACGAMNFAKEQGLQAIHLSEKQFETFDLFEAAMLKALKESHIDIILLAGYLRKVPPKVVSAFQGHMLNIHPALLPKYGGEGMYGERVHQAVIAAGERESGATVHLVEEEYDRGKIMVQEKVPVMPSDTPAILAERVLRVEHMIYTRALEKLLAELKAR
jgi:phosphoribosylglycinamide formyltransferase-1